MTVVVLDRCHLCDERATAGVFCRACLNYAAAVVDSLSTSAAAASAPEAPLGTLPDPACRTGCRLWCRRVHRFVLPGKSGQADKHHSPGVRALVRWCPDGHSQEERPTCRRVWRRRAGRSNTRRVKGAAQKEPNQCRLAPRGSPA